MGRPNYTKDRNSNVRKVCNEQFNKENIIEFLNKYKLIDESHKTYTSMVRGNCNNLAIFTILKLKKVLNPKMLKIITGKCGTGYHTWVEYGTHIIDLSAKQFDTRKDYVYVSNYIFAVNYKKIKSYDTDEKGLMEFINDVGIQHVIE